MRILVANQDHQERKTWLELPYHGQHSMDEVIRQLSGLAVRGEARVPLTIVEADFPVKEVNPIINDHSALDLNLEKINALAQKISGMDETERQTFGAVLRMEQASSLGDAMHFADRLFDYELLSGILSDQQLGEYLVENNIVPIHDSARKFVDHAKVAADYCAGHTHAYAESGAVLKKPSAKQEQTTVFDLQVTSDYCIGTQQYPVRFTLPAGENKLEWLRGRLHLENLDNCYIERCECNIPYMAEVLPQPEKGILKLNELAAKVEALSLGIEGQLLKLCAVLQAEQPEDVERMLEITSNLTDYEWIRDATNAWDYGHYVLYESAERERDFDFREEVEDFIDFEKYGDYRMEEDGVRHTGFGIVRRLSEPFEGQAPSMQMGMD